DGERPRGAVLAVGAEGRRGPLGADAARVDGADRDRSRLAAALLDGDGREVVVGRSGADEGALGAGDDGAGLGRLELDAARAGRLDGDGREVFVGRSGADDGARGAGDDGAGLGRLELDAARADRQVRVLEGGVPLLEEAPGLGAAVLDVGAVEVVAGDLAGPI